MADGKKKAEEQGFGEPAAAETKSKKPMLIMVLVVVAVVVFTCTLAFGKKIMAKDKKTKVVAEKGTIIPLDEFLVNLSDPGSDHFLKVSLALEFTKKSGKTAENIKEDSAQLRDAVLQALSTKTRDAISSDAGKSKLKTEIKDDVNKALGDDQVLNVYYTNFVTQ